MTLGMSRTWGRLRRVLRWPGRNGGTGRRGEEVAAAFLKQHDYQVLATNLRNRFGEIDLLAVAPDRHTVVVVEVKAREGAASLTRPETRVNRHKQMRLVTLACQIARRYRLTDRPIRFDVIGVDLLPGEASVVRHHPGAFDSHV